MSSSPEGRRIFAIEPLREKAVTDLVGISEKLGERLRAAGFDKVLFSFVHSFYIFCSHQM